MTAAPAPDSGTWRDLLAALGRHRSLLVAYSGGVDSTLLLAGAKAALGDNVAAAICTGPFTQPWELERARKVCRSLGTPLTEVDAAELDDPRIRANGPRRCYHCKRLRLGSLLDLAREMGLDAVAEGSHLDDAAADDRPGSQAVRELGVASPLAEAGLDKAAIRRLSRQRGLITASIPAAACLASRVPYGTPLDRAMLTRIAAAEAGVRELLGDVLVRVRDHFPVARLELSPEMIGNVSAEPVRSRVLRAVREAGYHHVCLDLAGYRTGGAQARP